MGKLSSKVAVVTGSSRGIGRGIALVLAENGATVYVTGRTVTPRLILSARHGRRDGSAMHRTGAARALRCRSTMAMTTRSRRCLNRSNANKAGLDILVNNAFQLADDLIEPRRLLGETAFQSANAAGRRALELHRRLACRPDHGAPSNPGSLSPSPAMPGSATPMGRFSAVPNPPSTAWRAIWRSSSSRIAWLPFRFGRASHLFGKGRIQHQRQSGDEAIHRHQSADRLVGRASRPGGRSACRRSGFDEAQRRHLHHRRGGAGIRHHRYRRENHPEPTRTARFADLAAGVSHDQAAQHDEAASGPRRGGIHRKL